MRDERLDQERLEREQAQLDKDQSQARLNVLRKVPAVEEEPQHVNLFEKEERAMVQQAVTGATATKRPPRQGVMPVLLGETEIKNRGDKRPFYLRSREDGERAGCSDKDYQRKARMDPMQRFVRNDKPAGQEEGRMLHSDKRGTHDGEHTSYDSDSDLSNTRHLRKRRGDKRHRKHRRHHKRSRKEDRSRRRTQCLDEASGPSMDELRRRRTEREQHESQREASLLQGNSSKTVHHYQDQYNPGLSRN